MNTPERHSVVATFNSRLDAERAISDLRDAGFRDSDIGYLYHDEPMGNYDDNVRRSDEEGRMATAERGPGGGEGAVTGAVTGAAVAGAAMAGLIPGVGPVLAGGILTGVLGGAAVGAATGGIAGSLIEIGVPAEDAGYYEDEFKSGRPIVSVDARDRYDDASHILDIHGGQSQRRM